MHQRQIALLTALVVLGATGLVACQPEKQAVRYGEKDPCLAEARSQIPALGISSDRLKSVNSVAVTGGGAGDVLRVVGVEAWLTLDDCNGSVVIVMDKFCRLKDAYARGNCQVMPFGEYKGKLATAPQSLPSPK